MAIHLLAGAAMAAPAAVKPRVLVLATGGTIAGQAASDLGKSYRAGGVGVEALLGAASGVTAFADVRGEQLASIGSQDMTLGVWRLLLARIGDAFAKDEADAVVITHGTDTLEETAFVLDLLLRAERPVVLVGAMRPANALGADGPANLAEAVRVAAEPDARGRGVLAVMDDQIHQGRRVRKTHTSALAAFKSPTSGPVGVVSPAGSRFFSPANPRRSRSYSLPADGPMPRVSIVYATADMDRRAVEDVLRPDVAGIVLVGVGNGNASAPALDVLLAAARRGVLVVRSTRVGEGEVDRDVEVDDAAAGFIAARGLSPQQSRLLLQLLIAEGVRAPADVQAAFDDP